MSEPAFINLDRKTVEAVLTAQVQSAVAMSIGNNPAFMDGIVAAMVCCKVDSDGKPTNYGGEPITAHIARKVIHEAVKVAVTEWANEQKPAIAKALRKHMDAKRGDIIKRFCEQAEKALDVDLGVSIRIREPS
jgi:hypothetical protein